MDRPKQNRVAVLSVMRGAEEEDMLRVHASVPYVSTLQHGTYPYVMQLVNRQFSDAVAETLLTLQIDFTSARQFGSPRLTDFEPQAIINPSKVVGKTPPYRRRLAKAASQITQTLPLDRIIDFLFALEDQIDLVQIFTDLPQIPWDWMYSHDRDKFLCELFGIGTTMPEEERLSNILFSTHDRALSLADLRSPRYSALVVGNSYIGTQQALPGIEESADQIASLTKPIFGKNNCIVLKDATAHEVCRAIQEHAGNLRLIVFCGHFTRFGFRCVDRYFGAVDVQQSLAGQSADEFGAQPIVILNGCKSGDIGCENLASYAEPNRDFVNAASNRNLASAILRHGADACVFTSARVRVTFASEFLREMIAKLLSAGVTLGEALCHARRQLDQGKCYEWATYHLLGDPTYTMVALGEDTPTQPA